MRCCLVSFILIGILIGTPSVHVYLATNWSFSSVFGPQWYDISEAPNLEMDLAFTDLFIVFLCFFCVISQPMRSSGFGS